MPFHVFQKVCPLAAACMHEFSPSNLFCHNPVTTGVYKYYSIFSNRFIPNVSQVTTTCLNDLFLTSYLEMEERAGRVKMGKNRVKSNSEWGGHADGV